MQVQSISNYDNCKMVDKRYKEAIDFRAARKAERKRKETEVTAIAMCVLAVFFAIGMVIGYSL